MSRAITSAYKVSRFHRSLEASVRHTRSFSDKEEKDDMDALLFIDTNILLDFYRDRKSDISIKFLEQIEACKDRLVLGSQVEIEYKKNRQHVILESFGKFGTPDWGKLSAPALVSEMQVAGMIDKHHKELVKQQNILTDKIRVILEKPGTKYRIDRMDVTSEKLVDIFEAINLRDQVQ